MATGSANLQALVQGNNAQPTSPQGSATTLPINKLISSNTTTPTPTATTTTTAPQVFDEKTYLASNPDVAKALQTGYDQWGNKIDFNTAYGHYNEYGKREGRVMPMTNAPVSYSSGSSPTTPAVTDNSAQISDQYAQSLSAAQDALKASIQQSMGTYQDTIAKAPTTYQPLRNQASAAGASNMQNLQEMLANGGQQGGVNRTESTAVNSATENNINNLNMQQQSVIDTANKAIADLQAQGDIKGAQLVADNASQKIQALIAESNRVDSATYSRGQDTFNNNIATANLANSTATTNANVANTNATTAYQNLVNAGYPAEQAIKMAQAQSSLKGTNLQNDYQSLVNAGYPAEEASKLAQAAAQTAGQNLQNTAQSITNQYLPSQLQATIAAANRSNTGGSSSSAATQKASTQANINSATAYVTKMVYTNNNTTAGALKTLTGNKGTIIEGLQSAGMTGKDALSYYTQMYSDLTK